MIFLAISIVVLQVCTAVLLITGVISGKEKAFMSAVHVFLKSVHMVLWYRTSQKRHGEQEPIKHILSSLKNIQNMASVK